VGGTGWILEKIARVHQSGLTITMWRFPLNDAAFPQKEMLARIRLNFNNQGVKHFTSGRV